MNENTPIFEIETLRNPVLYAEMQIREAAVVAASMKRGKLVLLQEPTDGP